MKILMSLLAILGLFVLMIGISTWIGVNNSETVVSAFFGLTFGITLTIGGSIILVFDLILLLIYLTRRNKKSL